VAAGGDDPGKTRLQTGKNDSRIVGGFKLVPLGADNANVTNQDEISKHSAGKQGFDPCPTRSVGANKGKGGHSR